MEDDNSSSSESEGSSHNEENITKVPPKTQTSLLSFVTRKRALSNDPLIDDKDPDSSSEASKNNEIVHKELGISEEEELKRKECKALDALIAVKERQLEDLKAKQKKYLTTHNTKVEVTPVTKSSFLLDKYEIRSKHPTDKSVTASPYKRFNKKTKLYTTNNWYLKISLFQSHPWTTYERGQNESGPGLVKCGICCLAKEKGCEMWYGGKKTSEEIWLTGSDCWVNVNNKKKWIKYKDSMAHLNAINFIYNQS